MDYEDGQEEYEQEEQEYEARAAQPQSKQRFFVGMDVWVWTTEKEEWAAGKIVSITKQLISVIFNGNDFRWLLNDSDHFSIKLEKPTNPPKDYISIKPNPEEEEEEEAEAEAEPSQEEFSPLRPGEMEYTVVFPENVLGLELYSDENGKNCIVGRCVSQIARQSVRPGSVIIQVNGKWVASHKFEDIRDSVKQAAKDPPLEIKFRIRQKIVDEEEVPNETREPEANDNQKDVNAVDEQPPNASGKSPNRKNKKQGIDPTLKNDNSKEDKQHSNQTHRLFEKGNQEESVPVDTEENETEEHFVAWMTFEEAEMLKPEQNIDHRDDVGRFLLAKIVDKQGTMLKVHYDGWNSKWDVWSDYTRELYRFAAAGSISRKPNTRLVDLKVRDYVDINPSLRHPGWKVGQIRRMDRFSGQVQVVYKDNGQEFLYWAHLNNPNEIASFMTKAEQTIQKHQSLRDNPSNRNGTQEDRQENDNNNNNNNNDNDNDEADADVPNKNNHGHEKKKSNPNIKEKNKSNPSFKEKNTSNPSFKEKNTSNPSFKEKNMSNASFKEKNISNPSFKEKSKSNNYGSSKKNVYNNNNDENNYNDNSNENNVSVESPSNQNENYTPTRRVSTEPPSRPLPNLNLAGKQLPPKPQKKVTPIRGKNQSSTKQSEDSEQTPQETRDRQSSRASSNRKPPARELPPLNHKNSSANNEDY